MPATDVWGVLMRKDSPLAEKAYIHPTDLLNKPLIISRQTAVSNELSGWLGEEIENLNVIGTYNLLYNASLLVKENIGYALCIDKLMNTSEESTLCFRPLSPKLEAGLNILWKNIKHFQVLQRFF